MGQALKILLLNICGLSLLAVGVGVWFFFQFKNPGPLEKEVSIVIERGIGIDAISRKLHRVGVLERPIVLRVAARIFNNYKNLKAGEYEFTLGISPEGILNLLQSGKTVVRRVTLAEGLSTMEILLLLQNTEGLQGTVFPIPGEGSLLPETYHFSFGDNRQDIVQRMAIAMRGLVASLWLKRMPNLPLLTPDEAVVLASIVEKETALSSERSRVAAVFINRIRKGMRLQSDPTVIYGLTKGAGPLGRKLTRSDLKFSTSYNTYLIRGLPPSPISSPGSASLQAVMHPAQTDDLYFVADGQGGHLFAKSLKEHNRNVAQWRKMNKIKR